MANYQTTRLLVCCALDRIWSSTQGLEDLDWFRPEGALCPVWGVVFLLYCSRAQVLKVQRGAYKPSSGVFSWSRTPWSPTVSYVGVFPFYSSRWGLLFTYIYRGVLVSPEGPSSLSVVGPARSVGSGEACVRLVLGDGLSSCCPVPGQSGWLRHSVGHSEVFSYPVRPYQLLCP